MIITGGRRVESEVRLCAGMLWDMNMHRRASGSKVEVIKSWSRSSFNPTTHRARRTTSLLSCSRIMSTYFIQHNYCSAIINTKDAHQAGSQTDYYLSLFLPESPGRWITFIHRQGPRSSFLSSIFLFLLRLLFLFFFITVVITFAL